MSILAYVFEDSLYTLFSHFLQDPYPNLTLMEERRNKNEENLDERKYIKRILGELEGFLPKS